MSEKTPLRLPKLSDDLEQMIDKLKNDLEKKVALHQKLLERMSAILSSQEFIYIEDGALLFQMATALRETISNQGVSDKNYKNLVSEFVKKVFDNGQLVKHSKEIGKLTMSLQDPKFRSSPDKLQDILLRICDLLVKFEWTCRMKKMEKLTTLDDIRQMVVETQKILLDQAKPKSKRGRPKKRRTRKIRKSKSGIQRSSSQNIFPTKERSAFYTEYESGYDTEPESQQDLHDPLSDVPGRPSKIEHEDGTAPDDKTTKLIDIDLHDPLSDVPGRPSKIEHEDGTAPDDKTTKLIDIVIDEGDADEVTTQFNYFVKMIKEGSRFINKLEVLDSEVKREHFVKLLQQLKGYYVQVRELSIEHISVRITNLIPYCCRIIEICKTKRLNLEFNNLQDAEIFSLQKNLKVENNLHVINISYNKNISPSGFFQLGKFVVKHSLKKFYAADCNLSDDSLEQFINGMKHAKAEQASADEIIRQTSADDKPKRKVEKFEWNPRNKEINTQTMDDKQTVLTQPAYEPIVRTSTRENQGISDEDLQKLRTDSAQYAQLEELDISYSKNLTSKGFTHLAELVRNKAVRRLKLSGFQLTSEKLGAFFTQLGADQMIEGSKPKELLVEDLEVSYNYTMEPEAYKILGQLVIFCGVKKLSLAGCGVNEEHLKHVREQTKNYKMTSLDASDNSSIGIGVIEIAKIVNQSNLEELDLSQCSLVSSELKDFREALGNATLRQLNLSDFGRDPNERYVTEVRHLLPHITEKLILEWKILRKRFRDQLRFALDNRKSELQIVLNEESGELLERNLGVPSHSSLTHSTNKEPKQ